MLTHADVCLSLLNYFREKTAALPSMPKIRDVAPWDGKDAPEDLIVEEEFSLEELMSDD